jgi:hypothetical protein
MRLIYSLRLDLERAKPGKAVQLIAPVDRAGHSRLCRPLNRHKRLVDLGPGDHVLHRGRVYRIQGVEPYRWHELSDDIGRMRPSVESGFVAAGDSA